MPSQSLGKKLALKPQLRLAVLHAPEGYLALLSPFLEGGVVVDQLEGMFDQVQYFVKERATLATQAPMLVAAINPGGILWIVYPKKSAKLASDLSREVCWEVMANVGWEPVAMVAIDEVWAAMRFKPNPY